MSQNGQTHFKVWFLKYDHFGTVYIEGLKLAKEQSHHFGVSLISILSGIHF